MTDYPINHHVLSDLSQEFREKGELPDSDVTWILASLHTMCNAYDEIVDKAASPLSWWCVARLKDSRESAEVDEDLSDAVIEREAERLELEIHKLSSSFVDNEFNEKE